MKPLFWPIIYTPVQMSSTNKVGITIDHISEIFIHILLSPYVAQYQSVSCKPPIAAFQLRENSLLQLAANGVTLLAEVAVPCSAVLKEKQSKAANDFLLEGWLHLER